MDWQPIETVPDGVAVLVWIEAYPNASEFGHVPASCWRAVRVGGSWFFMDWGVMRGFKGSGYPGSPTHWAPLPGRPK